jgi:hypothetical protein
VSNLWIVFFYQDDSILMNVRISGVGRPISASRYASQCVKYFRNIGGIPTPESHWGHEETCPICRFLPSRFFNLDDRQNQRCGSPDFGIKIRISMREIFQKYWKHSHFSITLGCGCLVAIWPCQDNRPPNTAVVKRESHQQQQKLKNDDK